MKNYIYYFIFIILSFACSSSRHDKAISVLPSEQKQLSTLSQEYPGLFSAADSYIHLPPDELERDAIVSDCVGGKSTDVIKNLFAGMKDATKVHLNNYYIALCYTINKDLSRGLYYFGKVAAQAPDLYLKSKAQMNMAYIQWSWGKSRKALSYAREAYTTKSSPSILYLLTAIELNLGLYQKVATRIPEMSKYNYTDHHWKFLLAQASYFISDYDQAVQHYGVLGKDFWENNADAMSHYIVSLYRTGRNQMLKNFVRQWKAKLLNNKNYSIAKNLYPEITKYE